MADFTGEVFTIPNPTDSTTNISYQIDHINTGTWVPGHVRIVASGIVVPGKRQASSSGSSGGAFGSNALDYTMRGFHQGLGQIVSWKAPFNDEHATQYFGNGGAPGTIINVVILSRK
jgi:hypothetical protein